MRLVTFDQAGMIDKKFTVNADLVLYLEDAGMAADQTLIRFAVPDGNGRPYFIQVKGKSSEVALKLARAAD
mgnify:CR=1 FL=1